MEKHKANDKGTRSGLRSSTSASNKLQQPAGAQHNNKDQDQMVTTTTTTKTQKQEQAQAKQPKVSKFVRAAQLLTISQLDPRPAWAESLTDNDIATASRWLAVLDAGHVDPLASPSDDVPPYPSNWKNMKKSLPTFLSRFFRGEEWMAHLTTLEAKYNTKAADATAAPTPILTPCATPAATPPPHASTSTSTSTPTPTPTAAQTATQTNKTAVAITKTSTAARKSPVVLTLNPAPSTDKHDRNKPAPATAPIFTTTRYMGLETNTGARLMSDPSTERHKVRHAAKSEGGNKDKDRYEGEGTANAGADADAEAAALHHRDKQMLTRLFRDLHRRRRLEAA